MAVGRLNRELHQLEKDPVPHIVVKPSPSSMFVWHYVLHDLPKDTAYAGGVYHGKLVFPQNYPFAPPAIYMITNNGRFQINTKLCLSMSDFHPESWNPSWRIESILTGLLSFMTDPTEPRTTGGLLSSFAHRRKLALKTFEENKSNKTFVELFPEFLDESKWDKRDGFCLKGHPSPSTPSCREDACGPESQEGDKWLRRLNARQLACTVLLLSLFVTSVVVVVCGNGRVT
ncbi:unnamed protein product [Vitrella brassicaformis CCMP3155]|uniref:UBC core domain-containing protein n=1 Tax=Vitrella brassicaformis (strain CCMP3155) TaxID=1169540 RepID=A0A0G4E8E7_VITBC|nr:unnamed protein product [Vitrella brassicaformis CCMP3155]|eukprot:CEL91729.1 unnamed protein product [Vitrella brassicaformis CCMP3155]